MATLLLSAAGAAIGAGFGGAVLGLSGAVIGRAIGATLGRVIDQRLLGAGSEPVDVGRIDRLRLTGAGEGASIGQLWGRMRVGGQIIWATDFTEKVRKSRSGKGAPKPKVNEYSYSVSMAVALCEGEILRVGRIWADGNEISPRDLNMRVYVGSENQLPDPKMEAIEGAGMVPAYRGLAYVVIEDLELAPFGNRVPQFSFEVVRPAQGITVDPYLTLCGAIQGVALIPGTGEYSLATTPVHYSKSLGRNRTANMHSASGLTDFSTSFQQLKEELPAVQSVSVVVSWFGNDLRCNTCELRPKVEQKEQDGVKMPWRAGGINRSAALEIPKVEGASIYGGTPADTSVIEAIKAIRLDGKEAVFYPFILMDQLSGNTLPDPWTGTAGQPNLPWRGRITLSVAPARDGTPDRTTAAALEVASFFGLAQPEHFSVSGQTVSYSGPADWGYRRFILHYATLCALAGGVDAFCIGSEMRSLTHIRGAADSFPAVEALRLLAADVRSILGPTVKIGYAADWSEYFGYQAEDNLYFHLDPLWSDPEVDFVGIDNYMPLSDWREGDDHLDATWGSIYNLNYLKANVAGGEGFDWYYDSPEGAAAQRRLPITDGAYGEPWVFRYKDIRSWWSNQHYERLAGVRSPAPTAWMPASKPIWFTEFGSPAVDKGSNQPNKFIDVKSSESGLPAWSNGRRDDLIQMQYLLATTSFWADVENNPISSIYGSPMVDLAHAYAWAWDARPFPDFPGQISVWNDGDNYAKGHWLNGRATNQPLAAVVSEICDRSGVSQVDTEGLYGLVRGYQQPNVSSARASLQPLLLAYSCDVMERNGKLVFRNRGGNTVAELGDDDFVVVPDIEGLVETTRASEADSAGQVRLSFVDAQSNYEIRAVEARFPDSEARGVSQTDLPLAFNLAEGQSTVDRWLAEASIARDGVRFGLPKSRLRIGAGDTVLAKGKLYRIDRVEQGDAQLVEGVRIEPSVYNSSESYEESFVTRSFATPLPVFPVFLDLPLLTGEEIPHAPYLAISGDPWPGSVSLWASSQDSGYELNRLIGSPAVIGLTESSLGRARPGVWDRGPALRINLPAGELSSADSLAVLNGVNAMAIGDGSSANWEIFQFAEAQIVAPDVYEVSLRLRGQLGTDGVMPDVWPAGSTVVLLDLSLTQIDLPLAARGLARYYRIGASSRGYDDPNTVLKVEAFDGIGLRPYSVAHLRAISEPSGDVVLSWKRRARIDGDTWQTVEVPLGEEAEAYTVRILQGSEIKAEYTVGAPELLYTTAMRATDTVPGAFTFEVAQQSVRFGPGPFRRLEMAS